MSSNDNFKAITLVAEHPQAKAHFKEIATPKRIIKKVRAEIIATACAYCTISETQEAKLKQCSRCKIASYCSTQCQKEDWPNHKVHCKKSQFSTEKLVKSLVANPLFSNLLRIAAIVEFGLDKRPPVLDRPLIAQCHLSILPSFSDMAGLLSRSMAPSQLEGTDGMIQAQSFNAAPTIPLEPIRYGLWKNVKSQNGSFVQNLTVVVVDFHLNNNPQGISMPIPITDDVLQIVRQNAGFEFESVLLERRTAVPFTVDACLDFINSHIRQDEHNQLMLRAPLKLAEWTQKEKAGPAENVERS